MKIYALNRSDDNLWWNQHSSNTWCEFPTLVPENRLCVKKGYNDPPIQRMIYDVERSNPNKIMVVIMNTDCQVETQYSSWNVWFELYKYKESQKNKQ